MYNVMQSNNVSRVNNKKLLFMTKGMFGSSLTMTQIYGMP